MQWIETHQALMLLAWPLLTAVLSLVYSRLDQVPRWHAFFAMLVSLGIDLPKLWAALGKLFGATKGPSGGAGGGDTLLGKTVNLRMKTDPPPAPR